MKTGALTDRVTIDGARATGVSYRLKGDGEIKAGARREVILDRWGPCHAHRADAIGPGPRGASPAAWRFRGSGRQAASRGQLQDHLAVPVYGLCKEPVSVLGQAQGFKGLKNFLQWYFFRTGLVTSNVVEAGGLFSISTAMGDATRASRSCRSYAASSTSRCRRCMG